MFRPGRPPLCLLSITLILVATTSVASALMPPQVAVADQPIVVQHVQSSAHAQALTGTPQKAGVTSSKYASPNPKARQKAAAYSHRAPKSPTLRRATTATRHASLLLPTLQEPPRPKPTHTQELGSLIDLGSMLQRMDEIVEAYRNSGKIAALRSAIDQRVRTAMRIAELDAAARSDGPHTARIAQRRAGETPRTRIAQARTRTGSQGAVTHDTLSNIDRRIAHLQQQREAIDRQIAQLSRQRVALCDGRTRTRDSLATNKVDSTATIQTDTTSAEAQQLIDSIARTDAMLHRTNLSPAERSAVEERRTELAERLTAIVAQSCRVPTQDGTGGSVHTASDNSGIITELRGTIRELKLEVARVSDELLRAQRGLVDRFDEIERRTNVIEAEIRSRMQRRAESNELPQRQTGEHAALGSSDL